jgi:uncharacterized protein YyaL (SSP411 family)
MMIEGAFYVWTREEIDKILGSDAEVFNSYFGVQAEGNIPPELDAHDELKGEVKSRPD